MPNWCNNELIIKGNRRDLIELKNKLQGDNGCFTCNNILPLEGGENTLDIADYWGSKWEPSEPSMNHDIHMREQSVDFIKDDNFFEEHDFISYVYATAWSPISGVVERLAELFPKLHFIYLFEEGGNDFHGIEEYLYGVQIRDLTLPRTVYGEDSGEAENLEEIEEALNGDGGYVDYVLKNTEFQRHIHSLYPEDEYFGDDEDVEEEIA